MAIELWMRLREELHIEGRQLASSGRFQPVVGQAVGDAIEACVAEMEYVERVLTRVSEGERDARYRGYAQIFEPTVRRLLASATDEEAVDAASAIFDLISDVVRDAVQAAFGADYAGIKSAINSSDARLGRPRGVLLSLRQLYVSMQRADESARAALAEAQTSDEARRKAMTVAASTGDEKLSKEFADLHTREAHAAGLWTGAAIVTTFAGVAAGWWTHELFSTATQLTSVLYPIVVAVGIAGLGAYFARLGGHRRHTAQWAKSIAVQLESYEKFIHHADEAARNAIFDRFAARVLGDPPARNAKSEQSNVTLTEVLALMAKQ